VEIADLARNGAHYVLLRGYVRAATGDLLPGEPRLFPVPALDSESRRPSGTPKTR